MKHHLYSPCQMILAVAPQEKHRTIQVLRLFPPQHGGGRSSHHPGSRDSLAWCLSCWNTQAAAGKGKWPPAEVRPSGSKGTVLISTTGGFGPPDPVWRDKQKHTSLGGLELKSPFACLEQDNLSDTSCCELCPLGHTCYCVTACLKNVGRRAREKDCNPICTNNPRTSLCKSFYHARCVHKAIASDTREKAGGGTGDRGEGEEEKSRLAMLGKCFCDHTMRFKNGWKCSPRSPAPSLHLPCLWKSYSGGFQG